MLVSWFILSTDDIPKYLLESTVFQTSCRHQMALNGCICCWFTVRIVGVNWESKPTTWKRKYGQTWGGLTQGAEHWSPHQRGNIKQRYQPNYFGYHNLAISGLWLKHVETPIQKLLYHCQLIIEDHHARHDGTILKPVFFAFVCNILQQSCF